MKIETHLTQIRKENEKIKLLKNIIKTYKIKIIIKQKKSNKAHIYHFLYHNKIKIKRKNTIKLN